MERKKSENDQIAQKKAVSRDARGLEATHSDDIPLVPWESLAHGKGHLQIAFQGQIYHLRVTRNGKLILTK